MSFSSLWEDLQVAKADPMRVMVTPLTDAIGELSSCFDFQPKLSPKEQAFQDLPTIGEKLPKQAVCWLLDNWEEALPHAVRQRQEVQEALPAGLGGGVTIMTGFSRRWASP
ncbi:MAG: hypothetical protein JO227_08410 [Acetobacteraceae bacterium]|nr:hypothetical protein [Acetobacteraceae bacterium]